MPTSWREHWDTTLWQVCKQKCWSAKTYSEDNHNCYSFVLTFLVTLGYGNLSEAARNRTLFCEKFIVPRTTAAGKYISLYRKLKEYKFYIHRNKWYFVYILSFSRKSTVASALTNILFYKTIIIEQSQTVEYYIFFSLLIIISVM